MYVCMYVCIIHMYATIILLLLIMEFGIMLNNCHVMWIMTNDVHVAIGNFTYTVKDITFYNIQLETGYIMYTVHEMSCGGLKDNYMKWQLLVHLQESLQEIVPYTATVQVKEISNCTATVHM